ncbi:hypothetical protein TWF106_007708 [Orbilia oligospora]|uniref:tyrosinase n=1 Tax=Orbilia oligospora TaxID=2813651 RepID=A0A7C8QPM9_ORBOL|nr:hypothetical protein TWF106_007708 [Orbilia oligospora]
MDVKAFAEIPTVRSRAYGRRWLPALVASICMVVTLFALGKLMVSHNVIRNERLLDIVDPLRMTTTTTNSDIFDAGTTVSGTDNGKSHKMEKRQSASRLLSTGINWNGVQQRRNWNDFAADRDLLNLFLCGMEAFQGMDQNSRESYFALAGIHGAPYREWNNAGGGNAQTGYCPHASILFPSWHRPYLATIEQILGNIMRNLANRYPAGEVRERYQRAANRFRLPYWDWASNARVPDLIGSQATVRVQKPQGSVIIANPMISYVFHPFSSTFFPFTPRRFNIFSNKAWNGGNSGNQDSIESIHDLIHGLVGGQGHMAIVDTSAMDPIFWLHHCVLNPNSWTTSQPTLFGTRSNPPGSVENAATPLAPFYKWPSTPWTSNTARDTKYFYYNYPETNGLSADDLRIRIQQLYGGTAPQNQVRGGASKRSYSASSLVSDGKYHEWSANIRLNKHQTSGTYLIHIFIGAPSNKVEWTEDNNFVGSYYLLTKNGTCSDCSDNALVTGSVPLTHMLIDCARGGQLKDLTPESVIPYLKDKLHWRVQLPGNNRGYINPQDVRSLKISVTSATVTLPLSSGQDAPITKWTTYYDVTNQKPGGLCYGDPN